MECENKRIGETQVGLTPTGSQSRNTNLKAEINVNQRTSNVKGRTRPQAEIRTD